MPYKDPEVGKQKKHKYWLRVKSNTILHEKHKKRGRDFMRKKRINPTFREIERQRRKLFRETHPEEVRISSRKHRKKLRVRLIELLGGKCVDCGYNRDIRGMNIDHINGGGTREEQDVFNHDTHAMYRWYLKHPKIAMKKLQILCAICNQIKRYTHGEGYIITQEH